MAPPDRWKHEATAFDRVLFFSDAVFAIAVTLLILPLADVQLARTDVGSQLVSLIPQMLTFALSFIVTGLFWISHHKWFQLVSAFDARSLWINMIFLLSVAFLPFPTSVLAQRGDTSAATAFYAGAIATTGLLACTMWWYMSRHRELLTSGRAPALLHGHFLSSLAAPIVFAVSIPLSYLDAGLAKYSWILTYPAARLIQRVTVGRK